MSTPVAGKLIATPLGGGTCCECWKSHTLMFSKEWYGYLPFDFESSDFISQVYRTFTIHVEVDMGVDGYAVFDGSVTFNRLNGWPVAEFTCEIDDVNYTEVEGFDISSFWSTWVLSDTDLLPDGSSPLGWDTTGATSMTYDDGAGFILTWALSDPYDLADLESDVDDMRAAIHAYEPDTGGVEVENRTVLVKYNSASDVACNPGSFPFPGCEVPRFSDGSLHYFPETKAIFDLIPEPADAPELQFVDTGASTLTAFNQLQFTFTHWFAGTWDKGRSLVLDSTGDPLCRTRIVVSTEESVADACAAVSVDALFRLLMDSPPGRSTASMVATDSWSVTDTLSMDSTTTAGGCPCT